MSSSSPAVWRPEKALLPPTSHACAASASPANPLVLKMHVAESEEMVSGRARNWVHEEREVARLRQRTPAAVAHAHHQETANAVVVRCLQERVPTRFWDAVEQPERRRICPTSNPKKNGKPTIATSTLHKYTKRYFPCSCRLAEKIRAAAQRPERREEPHEKLRLLETSDTDPWSTKATTLLGDPLHHSVFQKRAPQDNKGSTATGRSAADPRLRTQHEDRMCKRGELHVVHFRHSEPARNKRRVSL